MSVEAITWALAQPITHSSAKFVLVVLANCAAADTLVAYPSTQYIADATGQDRKTVLANLARLRDWGLIEDTGKRCGATGQIVVYRLRGPDLLAAKQSQIRNGPENGTVPKTERFRKRNSPKNGGKEYRFSLKQSQKRDTEPSEPSGNRRASEEGKPSSSANSIYAREVAIGLPLNDGSEYPITAEQAREFAGLYPAVDVPQALRSMRGWCVANPTNRKTRAGILRFVNRWLAKEQDSARPGPGGSHAISNSGCKLSAVERVQAAINERRQSEPIDIEGEATVLNP